MQMQATVWMSCSKESWADQQGAVTAGAEQQQTQTGGRAVPSATTRRPRRAGAAHTTDQKFLRRKSIILQLCHLVPATAVGIALFYPHQKLPPFLGHINRLKFMSSPSLSELGKREQAALDERGTQQGQAGSNATWNSIHNGVISVFKNAPLPEHELYCLNEGVRHLLKTELGSFFTEYLQNQLLTKGMVILRDKIRFCDGQMLLDKLGETWDFFFTYVLPMLQAIFYPVQGKDPSIRQLALLHFRNIIALHSKLEDNLMKPTARIPPSLIQMLLILQGVHESKGVTENYIKLEKLVQVVVSPYLGTYGLYTNDEPVSHSTCILEERTFRRCLKSGEVVTKNPVVRSKSYNYSLLTPVAEYEAENAAAHGSGIRRHSVSEMSTFDMEEDSILTTIMDSGSKISVNATKVQPTGEQDHTTVVSAHSTSVQYQGTFYDPGTRDDQSSAYKLSVDTSVSPAPSSSPETIVDQILESIDSDSEGIFIDFERNCASSSGYNTDVNRQSIV